MKESQRLKPSPLRTELVLTHKIIRPVCNTFELDEKPQFTKTLVEYTRITPVFPLSKIGSIWYTRYYCLENGFAMTGLLYTYWSTHYLAKFSANFEVHGWKSFAYLSWINRKGMTRNEVCGFLCFLSQQQKYSINFYLIHKMNCGHSSKFRFHIWDAYMGIV